MFTCFHRKASFWPQSKSLIPQPQRPQPGKEALGRDGRLPGDSQAAYSIQEAAWGLGGSRGGEMGEEGGEKGKEGGQRREEGKGSGVARGGPALHLDNLLFHQLWHLNPPRLCSSEFKKIPRKTHRSLSHTHGLGFFFQCLTFSKLCIITNFSLYINTGKIS